MKFMHLLNKIYLNLKPIHIFALFVFFHLLLLNFNAAEWGDSYRILRATEFIKNDFTYPEDEKRPPLYSLVLAFRPQNIDAVLWGRLTMFVVSILAFVVFYRLLQKIFPDDLKKQLLGLLLFTLNPVYLYWSIRIMSDVFFSLIILTGIYYYESYKHKIRPKNAVVLGILAGLAILTRFEGFILFGAFGLGLLYTESFNLKKFTRQIAKNLKTLFFYVISAFAVLLPYWLYRNPLDSTYFEEPASRTYDLNTILIFLGSLFFVFGFVYAFYFIFQNRRSVIKFLSSHIAISAFIFVELILILAWPAAIPRLFVPIIPFLIIILADSIIEFFFNNTQNKIKIHDVILLGFLLIAFLGIQYVYKLQFLILIKPVLGAVVVLSVFQALAIYKKNYNLFLFLLIPILTLWSFATIYIHKDIFAVIKEANVYVINNLEGRVGYNDISSVSDWYLNQRNKNDDVEGFYYDLTNRSNRTYEKLIENNVDYITVTNEHNTTTELDLDDWEHLEVIKEFKKEINGKEFWTRIIKFNK